MSQRRSGADEVAWALLPAPGPDGREEGETSLAPQAGEPNAT
jgi:hypothetical protein